jgi:uncharacterized protein (DUF433 family)
MARRKINARGVIIDIEAGLTDSELMAKYSLSAKGLQSMFKKLVEANLISELELDQRNLNIMGTVILSLDGLEPDEAQKPEADTGSHKAKKRPPISSREAVKDIQSGISDSDLMAKYGLSAKGLQSMFTKLVAAKRITWEEIEERMPTFDSTVDLKATLEELMSR